MDSQWTSFGGLTGDVHETPGQQSETGPRPPRTNVTESGSRYGMTNIMSRHVGAVSARARSRFRLRDGVRSTKCPMCLGADAPRCGMLSM